MTNPYTNLRPGGPGTSEAKRRHGRLTLYALAAAGLALMLFVVWRAAAG